MPRKEGQESSSRNFKGIHGNFDAKAGFATSASTRGDTRRTQRMAPAPEYSMPRQESYQMNMTADGQLQGREQLQEVQDPTIMRCQDELANQCRESPTKYDREDQELQNFEDHEDI